MPATKGFEVEWKMPPAEEEPVLPPAGQGAKISEEQLAAIAQYSLASLQASDLYVREMRLCNDQLDRSWERLPVDYLQRFAETLPGKSVLLRHDKRGSMPVGRFFEASVEQEGGVNSLRCAFYCLADDLTAELRANVDAGVWRDVSISFSFDELICDLCGLDVYDWGGDEWCPHCPGEMYKNGRATATYGGDLQMVEAIEGSLVYLGCQYEALVTKEAGAAARASSARDDSALRAAFQARLHQLEARLAPPEEHPAGSSGVAASAGEEKGMPEKRAGEEFTSPEITRLEAERVKLADQLETAIAERVAIEEQLAHAQALAVDGELYRADLKAEMTRLAGILGSTKEAEVVLAAAKDAPAETLKSLQAEYQARVEEKFPPRGKGLPPQRKQDGSAERVPADRAARLV